MAKKYIIIFVVVVLVGAGIAWAANFYWRNLRGIGPAILPPPRQNFPLENLSGQATSTNRTGLPLKLPSGFSIETFAKNVSGARVMAFDSFGNLWVSKTKEGEVDLLEIKDGKVVSQNTIFKNLRKPHGLAFDPDNQFMLYVALEHRIVRVPVYSEGQLERVIDLPSGGNHFTRTIEFGNDGRLYVSIGSSCNVCNETDSRRAKIFSLKKDGSDFKEFARGLRNAVFFTWHPKTKQMWATEMGRDLIGDDIPPDEINVIRGPSTGASSKPQPNSSGQNSAAPNFGWPICYGKNIHDTNFDKNTYIRNPCEEPFETPSHIDLQAHSAPLGLAFVPANSNWPKEYWNNLIVAYHGSWNRSVPTGYKLVRIKLDENGKYLGTDSTGSPQVEDFITGWLTEKGALGRPVDVKFGPDGVLYVSDDHAGVIYRVAPIQ